MVPGPPQPQPELEPMRVDTARIIAWGLAVWAVALVVILAVPSLRTGDRAYWPWVCVAAIVGGFGAWAYVRRGRGNAASA